jgi:hypothetical protein
MHCDSKRPSGYQQALGEAPCQDQAERSCSDAGSLSEQDVGGA